MNFEETIPARQKTLLEFKAPNPWSSLSADAWSLELCSAQPVSQVHLHEWEIPKNGSSTRHFQLRRFEILSIRSDSSGKRYPLPRQVSEMYLAGQIDPIHIPSLLMSLGTVRTAIAQRTSPGIFLFAGLMCLSLVLGMVVLQSVAFSRKGTFVGIYLIHGLTKVFENPMNVAGFLLGLSFIAIGIFYHLEKRTIRKKISMWMKQQGNLSR